MKTPSALILAAATCLLAGNNVANAHTEFNVCEGNKNSLGINSLEAKVENGFLKVTAKGDVPSNGGRLQNGQLIVKAVGIPVVTETIDIISGTKNLRSGDKFEETFVQEMPGQLPKDFELNAQLSVFATDGTEASCVEFNYEMEDEVKKTGLVSTNPFSYAKFLFEKWLNEFESELPVELDDVEQRFEVFTKNLMKIVFHNGNDEHTYKMAMNQFGAMTGEEFKNTMTGYKKPPQDVFVEKELHVVDKYEKIPDTVDWTTKGAVTGVKNQGACGSCWSFSTTGSLEGAYFLKTGKLISFSEEQLVTCDHTDMGCNGGLMDYAFQWIIRNGGLCEEKADPYVSGGGRLPRCDRKCKVVANSAPKSYVDVPHNTKALMSAVAKTPVSIAIEADQGSFQFYSHGVLTGRCGTQLDHGVLLVGYGTENGVEYWKVKNSWGPMWGSKGYIKFQRGKKQIGGECGILNSASYPTL